MIKVKSTPIFKMIQHYSSLLLYHFFILWGGRGSGKTQAAIEKLILDFVNEDRCNYLFGVYNSNKVRTAFEPKIRGAIEKFDLYDDLTLTLSPLTVCNKYGRYIYCTGFDDPEKAKNLSNIGKALLDELPAFPLLIFRTIVSTVREIEDFEIYATFNPVSPDSWVKTDLLDDPFYKSRAIFIHSTCEDNPFLPESVKDLYRSYTGLQREVDYLGKFGVRTNELVFGAKLDRIGNIPEFCNFLAYGLDYSNGGADPHSLVGLYYGNECLYILPIYEGHCPIDTVENYQTIKGNDLLTIITDRCTELGKEHYHGYGRIIADRANPANTDKLRAYGINVQGYDGRYTRDFGLSNIMTYNKIYIVESDNDFVRRQFYNYKWKVDKMTGRITDEPDKSCEHHSIDATCYGLLPFFPSMK